MLIFKIILIIVAILILMMLLLALGEKITRNFSKSKFAIWWRNNIIEVEKQTEPIPDWDSIWRAWIRMSTKHTGGDFLDYLKQNYNVPEKKK